MSTNRITKAERREVPKVIDAALLASAAAEQANEHRPVRVIHLNRLGVSEGLHRKMTQFLDQLSDSLTTQMESVGVHIGLVQISWRPNENDQAVYEKLSRSQLVLEVRPALGS
jgi:hypothetical protein